MKYSIAEEKRKEKQGDFKDNPRVESKENEKTKYKKTKKQKTKISFYFILEKVPVSIKQSEFTNSAEILRNGSTKKRDISCPPWRGPMSVYGKPCNIWTVYHTNRLGP